MRPRDFFHTAPLLSKFLHGVVHILTIAILLCFSGCSKEHHTVSMGYVSSGLTGLAVKVMKDKKTPERYGVDVEYVGFANPQALNNAFFLGRCDINIAAGSSVVALKAGKPPRFVYFHPTLLNSVSLLVKAHSPYKSLADLKGQKIGWYGPLSGGGTGFIILGKQEGFDISGDSSSDFKMVQTNPAAERILLDRGEVEAIIVYEPIAGKMLASGKYRKLLGPFWKEWQKKTQLKMEMAGLAARTEWFSKNEENAKKVVLIWRDTVDYITNNADAVLDEYPSLTDLITPDEKKNGKVAIDETYVGDWQNIDKSIEAQLKSLKDSGVLENYSTDFLRINLP